MHTPPHPHAAVGRQSTRDLATAAAMLVWVAGLPGPIAIFASTFTFGAQGSTVTAQWGMVLLFGGLIGSSLGNVAAGIRVLRWIWRAWANAAAVATQRWSQGWVIAGWFVPVLNLGLPALILSDIVRTSTVGRATSRIRALVAFWWVTWLSGGAALGTALVGYPFLPIPESFAWFRAFSGLAVLLLVTAAALFTALAHDLSAQQDRQLELDDDQCAGGPQDGDPEARPTEPTREPETYTTTASPESRDAAHVVGGDHAPVASRPQPRRRQMLLAIIAGSIVLVVLIAFATIGVVQVVAGGLAPGNGPTSPSVGTSDPTVAPAAADVLAAMLAQSRRDGSGTFSFSSAPGDSVLMHEFPNFSAFSYQADTVSMRASYFEHPYIAETTVIDGRRYWFKSRYPEPEGSWFECSSLEGAGLDHPGDERECQYASLMQDLADPVQLLSRAGAAVHLVTSEAETIDGSLATRYEFTFDRRQAVGSEIDPHWRQRFADSWMNAASKTPSGTINLWVDSQFRLLRMSIGRLISEDNPVVYHHWGTPQPIPRPTVD